MKTTPLYRRANSQAERSGASAPSGEVSEPPTPSGQPFELSSLILVRASKKRDGYSFLFNGQIENLNPALGELLRALGENVPDEKKSDLEKARIGDLYGDWRSRGYLLDQLGISMGALESRLRRLRRFFRETFGADLVLMAKRRNAKLRLRLRRNPGFSDQTGNPPNGQNS